VSSASKDYLDPPKVCLFELGLEIVEYISKEMSYQCFCLYRLRFVAFVTKET
jgi:hypothetical protein